MFEFNGKTKEGVRLGTYKKSGNNVSTPCFFCISNLGGGGTNVSRFVSYLDLWEAGDSQILLNYYYLNTEFKKTMEFDGKILSKISKFCSINDFLIDARDIFVKEKGRIAPDHKYCEVKWNPIIMLDSGSGNIFRDLIQKKQLTQENFKTIYTEEVKKYLEFGISNKFDIIIAMDIAAKYTSKNNEHLDSNYKNNLEFFTKDESNFELLRMCLNLIPKDKNTMIFAPIHGSDKENYIKYLKNVISLEASMSKKFDGFAVGGLGIFGDKSIIYDICRAIRAHLDSINDDRPIHVLGVGGIENIIPLTIVGIDSFDCHTPWRRASEGKFIVPLVNSKGEIIAKNNEFWDYVEINSFKEANYTCDCEVCKTFGLDKLKSLCNDEKEKENMYYAWLLFYKHNISQQEFLINAIKKNGIKNIISNMPKSRDKVSLVDYLSKRFLKEYY